MSKPKSKSIDSLSDKRWQNTWVWHYTVAPFKFNEHTMARLQRNIIWAAIIALLLGVGFVTWLAWQLSEIVGVI